jgi:hypothetical protein
MAWTGNHTCNSFKVELLQALHNFSAAGGDTFKIALYDSTAGLDASTTVYTVTGEVGGTGYTAGGASLSNVEPTSAGSVGVADFADASWAASTITARGALIYNSTNGNRAVAVLDFGAEKSSSASTFTVTFPEAGANSAIVRIA